MSTEPQRTILSKSFDALDALPAPGGRRAGAVHSAFSDTPLPTMGDEQLSPAVADNLHALFRAMGALPGAEVEVGDTLSRHHAAPVNPMFKGVWAARLKGEDADAAIARSIDWFRARHAPFFFWWTDARTQPADLPARLATHGFVPWEVDAPGMAAPLAALHYDQMTRVPDTLRIERVRDEAGLIDFKQAFVQGLEVPEWAGQAWVEATLSVGIEQAPWQCYVGYLDGAPVASNILFCGAGVASVFGVATLPAARKQGIGAAITLRAYRDALAQGYRYGVLFATELGLPVYERIGFRATGSGISRYLWRP